MSDPSRTDPSGSAGTPGYHQIWVPDLKVGDLANTYSDYGLYLPTKASEVQFGYAYGDYDSATAQEYYEQHASEIKKQEGKGQVKGFVIRPGEQGANQLASWGTIPNTATAEIIAHEIGHLMGLNHDSATCEDNLMSPSHPDNKNRTQVYPKYFSTMLDELDLFCQWTVRTNVTLLTPSGNYTPTGLQAHSEVILKEEPSAKNYIAAGTADVIYDDITKEFHEDEFGWVPHNGAASYQAEIFYNYKEDLKTGGRMLLLPTLTTEPWEELTYIKSPHRLDPYDLQGAPTHHTNVKSALDGTDLVAEPYTYAAPSDVSCPAQAEPDFTQQYYVDGVRLDGIKADSKAEHFTDSSLYAAQFKYDITVTDAQPLVQ